MMQCTAVADTFWKSCDGDESGNDHLMSNLTGEGADLLEVGRVVRIAVDQHLILIDCLHDVYMISSLISLIIPWHHWTVGDRLTPIIDDQYE